MRLALALTLSLLTATAAGAQSAESDTQDVDVHGNVADLCILGTPNPPSIDVGQMAVTSGARTGRIDTGIPDQIVQLPASFCNYAGTRISISATAMTNQDVASTPANFTRAVNFTASVAGWTGTPAEVTTSALADGSSATANAAGGTQPAPQSVDLVLTLSDFSTPGDPFMSAGDYLGAVTITLGPDLQSPPS